MLCAWDYVIIAVYLVLIVLVGVYVTKKVANSTDGYFLAGKALPWWMLGLSGMSSNLDITGTSVNIALLYVLGISGFYVELRGGVTAALAFLMVLGKYNRRAKVMTVSEFMELRFGKQGGQFCRVVMAIASLLFTLSMLSYASIGSGKFLAHLLDIPNVTIFGFRILGQHMAAAGMITLCLAYVIQGGLVSVIYTDLVQSLVILSVIIYAIVRACLLPPLPASFDVPIPTFSNFTTIEVQASQWASVFPPADGDFGFPDDSPYQSMFSSFYTVLGAYLFKAVLEGLGNGTGYMSQRYFSSASDADTKKMTILWILCLSLRWPFSIAMVLMAVNLNQTNPGAVYDPEAVLAVIVRDVLPYGVKGLMVSGLLSAAMSTIDSTLNAGMAYWVQDIYSVVINKNPTNKQLMWHSRVGSVLLTAAAFLISTLFRDINQIWDVVNMVVSGSFLVPVAMRWYFSWVTGYGFGWGMLSAMGVSMVLKVFLGPYLRDSYALVLTSIISAIVVVVVSVVGQPVAPKQLLKFYIRCRPIGFWKSTRALLPPEIAADVRSEHCLDGLSLIFALPWQLLLFLCTMSTLLLFSPAMRKQGMWLAVALGTISVVLFFTFFRHINGKEEDKDGTDDANQREDVFEAEALLLVDGGDLKKVYPEGQGERFVL